MVKQKSLEKSLKEENILKARTVLSILKGAVRKNLDEIEKSSFSSDLKDFFRIGVYKLWKGEIDPLRKIYEREKIKEVLREIKRADKEIAKACNIRGLTKKIRGLYKQYKLKEQERRRYSFYYGVGFLLIGAGIGFLGSNLSITGMAVGYKLIQSSSFSLGIILLLLGLIALFLSKKY